MNTSDLAQKTVIRTEVRCCARYWCEVWGSPCVTAKTLVTRVRSTFAQYTSLSRSLISMWQGHPAVICGSRQTVYHVCFIGTRWVLIRVYVRHIHSCISVYDNGNMTETNVCVRRVCINASLAPVRPISAWACCCTRQLHVANVLWRSSRAHVGACVV